MPDQITENAAYADRLNEYADLLAQQNANGFRVSAYRQAADTVARLDKPVREILKTEGRDGLIALPTVGRSIASALAEMVTTGRWSQLDRIRGSTDPERLFLTVPGIGPKLAHRIHDRLHIDTLEALELAAYDGRLEQVTGFGTRRAQIVRAALAQPSQRHTRQARIQPPVSILLDVDSEHREMAASNALPKIAPKRFNPRGEAWLSILHTRREPWEFTALYSNTWLAHELGRTNDWIIIYYHADNVPEGQCTVVTETVGPLATQRVVRGREQELLDIESSVSKEPLAATQE